MNIKKIILEEIRRSIFEGVEHMENLYKAWANKKSGNPEAAMKIMDDVISNRRSLPKKDFAKYNSYEELLKDLNMIKASKVTDDITKFYEDKDLLVIAANTWESSCKYGAGSKWCTTARDTNSYWERHNSTGTEFFWIFKNKPQDDPNHKFSHHIKIGGEMDWCNAVNNCRTNLPETSYPKQHPKYEQIIEKLIEYHDSRGVTVPLEKLNGSYIYNWLNNNEDEVIQEFKTLLDINEFIESYSSQMLNTEVMDNLFATPSISMEELFDHGVDEDELFDRLLTDLENLPIIEKINIDYDLLLEDLRYTVMLILRVSYGFNNQLPYEEQIEEVFGRPLEVSDILNKKIVKKYDEEFHEILDEVVGMSVLDIYYNEADRLCEEYLEEYI